MTSFMPYHGSSASA